MSDEPVLGLVEFVGGPVGSYPFGDLNFDGELDSEDWTTLGSRFGANLVGLTRAQRYRAADLNEDGGHTLDDVLAFRLAYDAAHGAGAFAAMVAGVPEPGGLALAAIAVSAGCAGLAEKRPRRLAQAASGRRSCVCSTHGADGDAPRCCFNRTSTASLSAQASTNCRQARMCGPRRRQPGGRSTTAACPRAAAPSGAAGRLPIPSWWATVAEDQGRSQFTKASGAIAVADPDEWDDATHDPGTYNTFMRTAPISFGGVAPGTASLRFDSSWMPEVTQTASVAVSYNGGSDVELFRWTSVNGDANFKNAATNETVVVPLNNPAGATSVTIKFGLFDAGNNWWWAIDNLVVFTPLTLQVDVQTGAMTLLGDASVALTGYEISSRGEIAQPRRVAGRQSRRPERGQPHTACRGL